MDKKYVESLKYLRSKTDHLPKTGIILGTGLGALTDIINIDIEIPYEDIPHFPVSTVEGHHGKLIFGSLGRRSIIAMKGRFHYYEGYSMQEVTYPVRIMKLLGIKEIIVSNAAGGVNPDFSIGDLMIINDHINFFPDNPLRGPNEENFGPRFPDMSQAYNKELIYRGFEAAKKLNIQVHEGVYLGNPGPSFETPAEYTHYRNIGADAIGMSTVPEVILANHMSLKVFGISVITNIAVPGNFDVNSHVDVQKAAARAQQNMSALIEELISSLD